MKSNNLQNKYSRKYGASANAPLILTTKFVGYGEAGFDLPLKIKLAGKPLTLFNVIMAS